jgi:hypothetical protein
LNRSSLLANLIAADEDARVIVRQAPKRYSRSVECLGDRLGARSLVEILGMRCM